MKRYLLILIYLIFVSSNSCAKNNLTTLKELKNYNQNKIFFMRHSLAPGNGDPSNFIIDDCSTQRNLGKRGIKQSKKIGNSLKENQINFVKIFSSFWCRCRDTAFYLNIGDYFTHKGLNSFYEGHVDKNKTLQELNKLINSLSDNKGPYLMVTHFVVIQAISGLSVSSGGMIVYDMKTKKSEHLQIID
jgi:phosphohistidine phosphatase SixA